jgi:hypothetical protein
MRLLFLFCGAILFARGADTQLLIDAIPTGGAYGGSTLLGLPFRDAETANLREVTEGINGAITQFLPAATQQGFTFLCLLSIPGTNPIEIPVRATGATLKLSRKQTKVVVLFYQGGHAPAGVSYSLAVPPKASVMSASFEKISVPEGTTAHDWIYFNLTRLQAELEKAKTPTLFLQATGEGALIPVAIPGLNVPLLIPEKKTKFTASWAMGPDMEKQLQLENPTAGEVPRPIK